MSARAWWLGPVAVVAALAQTESPIAREGSYWVQTASGSATVDPNGRLKISTRGEVSVRGDARHDIVYTLKKRYKTGLESAARQELAKVGFRVSRSGEWTVLILDVSDRSRTETELRVQVPRGLRESVIISQGGSVQVSDLDGSVRADTGGGQMDMDRIHGDLKVSTGGGNIRLGKIGGSVNCSSGGGSITADSLGKGAEFSTGGGEISVREAGGAVRVSTGGGNIRAERTLSLHAATGGGVIEVLETSGPVTCATGSGPIKIRLAKGVRCSSGGGPINLYLVSGRLEAATGFGNILAELAAALPLEDSSLTTGSGDIIIVIPSNLAVTVQANASGGGYARIVSDFAEIQPRREGRGSEARGALNGGGPLLRLAASGTIYLRRQK